MSPWNQAIELIRSRRLHVIDSYSLQGYLGSTREDVDSPPLRFLQTDSLLNTASDRLHLYDVPNLVTGLSAAITGQVRSLILSVGSVDEGSHRLFSDVYALC